MAYCIITKFFQITLKSFLRGSDYGTSIPSDEVLRKFDQWVINQSRQALRPIPYPGTLAQFPYHLGSPNAIPYDKELMNNSFDERIHPALQVKKMLLSIIFAEENSSQDMSSISSYIRCVIKISKYLFSLVTFLTRTL